MTIPTQLQADIKAGKVVLFLGSGATAGALSRDLLKPPLTGKELQEKLTTEFGIVGDTLESVSAFAESLHGRDVVEAFIANYLENLIPNDFHFKIPKQNWAMIATTNYNLVLERSYEQSKKPLVTWVSGQKPKNLGTLYLKMHGCIAHIGMNQPPLALTQLQMDCALVSQPALFLEYIEMAKTHSMVYVGFGFGRSNITWIEKQLHQALGNARPPRYAVTRKPLNAQVQDFLKTQGIKHIGMDAKDFFDAL